MKIDPPDRFISLAIKALDHYYEYTRAVQLVDSEYKEAADFFREVQRKEPGREEATPARTKRA